MRESPVQQRIRLAAAQQGNVLLLRNNSGALMDQQGRLVRFGLGNESKAVNEQIKSADLIGITMVQIGPEHVGRVMGVFTSVECKRSEGGVVKAGQINWETLVRQWGGRAGIASSVDEARGIWT